MSLHASGNLLLQPTSVQDYGLLDSCYLGNSVFVYTTEMFDAVLD